MKTHCHRKYVPHLGNLLAHCKSRCKSLRYKAGFLHEIMFNARTWHWLCISAYPAAPAVLLGWVLPGDSPFLIWVILVFAWGMLIAVLGALQGVLFAFGRLRMGCPDCNSKCLVTGGARDGMWLDCPKCGEVQFRVDRLGRLHADKAVEEAEELEVNSESPLRAPLRHPIASAVIFLPVVGSIIAASVIHRFSFFYLLIPGFWCYGVGGFILDGIFSGRYGNHSRSRAPIRFWGNIAIWAFFYLFAAFFPIGFALQESGREKEKIQPVSGSPPAAEENE